MPVNVSLNVPPGSSIAAVRSSYASVVAQGIIASTPLQPPTTAMSSIPCGDGGEEKKKPQLSTQSDDWEGFEWMDEVGENIRRYDNARDFFAAGQEELRCGDTIQGGHKFWLSACAKLLELSRTYAHIDLKSHNVQTELIHHLARHYIPCVFGRYNQKHKAFIEAWKTANKFVIFAYY